MPPRPEELPTYEELGREVVVGAIDDGESLDLVELAMNLEERQRDDAKEEVVGDDLIPSAFDLVLAEVVAVASLPDDWQRRMSMVHLLLKNGVEVRTTVTGVSVTISPNDSISPPRGPDPSGDREPLISPDPTTSGAMALEVPVLESDQLDSTSGIEASSRTAFEREPATHGGLSGADVVRAGREALRELLEAGQERVVGRDGRVQVLQPGDEVYWENTGFPKPESVDG